MDTNKLQEELPTKKRSVDDLFRYIVTRTDNNPNYSLLLGSGCSVTSGIKSAKELIECWRKDIFESYEDNKSKIYSPELAIDYLSTTYGSWYNPANEYCSLFEKKYDLPKQRRLFVEQEVDGKLPSLGYSYLINLVTQTYFNTIFTTNFDDLINEAFYRFADIRPILCAHDSSIKSITVTSKRPKIIKLHGDYLFDDIKSTLRETESLEDNIRNKLIEYLKDYGLIVVGYAGSDRSVMDVLTYLLKQEDYLKNGIYWCIRKNDHVSEELRKLIWKDRVYYVEIDGFDELFADLFERINGNKLPIDTNFVSNKSQEIIKGFLNNSYLQGSGSSKINSDIQELKKHSARNDYFNIIRQIDKYSNKEQKSDNLTDKEVIILIEIKNKINHKNFDEAIHDAKTALTGQLNNYFAIELYDLIIQSYVYLEKYDDAISCYDNLIELDPKNPIHLLNKAEYIIGHDKKMTLIQTAIEKDIYYYKSYYEKAAQLIDEYMNSYSDSLFADIVDTLNLGVKRYPYIMNPCWEALFNFYKDARIES